MMQWSGFSDACHEFEEVRVRTGNRLQLERGRFYMFEFIA